MSIPLTPGAAPLRNQLDLPEGDPRFLGEMVREVRDQAVKRLGDLEAIFGVLQNQARLVVGGTKRDLSLHAVPLNGTKLRGRVYHLLQRPDATKGEVRFFSVLSAAEYQQINPAVVGLGSYQLNFDSSWTRVDADDNEDRVRFLLPDGGRSAP